MTIRIIEASGLRNHKIVTEKITKLLLLTTLCHSERSEKSGRIVTLAILAASSVLLSASWIRFDSTNRLFTHANPPIQVNRPCGSCAKTARLEAMPKTLLFIGAHPDDETFGVGGTLAKYASEGVKVYYACATRGEAGTSDAESMRGYASIGDMRWGELECAAKVLGLSGIFHLGYRDSGMAGSPDNQNPASLNLAPTDEVAGHIVKLMRQLKPQVVVTHDPLGGYRHPDHIATHKAATAAFYAAGEASQYPHTGPAFQPQKLYYGVFPHRWLKLAVRLMPLFGQNPRRFGRNHDIDLAALAAVEFPIHARIRIDKRSQDTRTKAVACYCSQSGGGPPRKGLLRWLNIFSPQRDYFMRAYPEAKGKIREIDLFEGASIVESPSAQ